MQVVTVFLEVGLPLLEETLFRWAQTLAMIVPICIGPLEDLPA